MSESSDFFFVDTTPAAGRLLAPAGLRSDWEMFGMYSRQTAVVVGLPSDPDEEDKVIGDRRCFNCGSPEHVISSCPEPQDRQIINLSVSLFDFHKNLKGSRNDFRNAPRLHDVATWKAQRLRWIDFFVPGQVKGELLQEAMGNDGGDWLRNIARLGYPPGWTGDTDPRDRMRQRILSQTEDVDEADEKSFLIIGEEEELVPMRSSSPSAPSVSTLSSDSEDSQENPPRRWATYPASHFLSHLLPIYKPSPPEPVSASLSLYEEQQLWKQQLWESILLSLPSSTKLEEYYQLYFWYLFNSQHLPPPEPTEEPPPLPPPPPEVAAAVEINDGEEMDMDLSD